EVADIFHRHRADWRRANAGHVSLGQLQVMSAIEQCRSAALGEHVERCQDCGHSRIAYNSCRNRHCPKCYGAAAKDWLTAPMADLWPVGYLHVGPIGQIVPAMSLDERTSLRNDLVINGLQLPIVLYEGKILDG